MNQQILILKTTYVNGLMKPKVIIRRRVRRVWRYQRGNQNPYTQWPKEKVQKNKQRSTKHTYKNKDRVT